VYYCDQIKEDEVSRVHSVIRSYKKCIQNFGQRDHLDNQGIDVRTVLKKWGARVWNGFVQLKTTAIDRLL
jgi:predicted lipase